MDKLNDIVADGVPSLDDLQSIREILNFRTVYRPFVPPMDDSALEELENKLAEELVADVEVESIRYGRKYSVRRGDLCGEVNVFWTKDGYSVVVSPKSGTNYEMNNATFAVVSCFLESYYCPKVNG